jgi:UPF0042 nucleotide-binding protein
MKTKKNSQRVIVTGLSGAGMSSVLKALEDFGFEVFDNFPLSLVGPLLEDAGTPAQSLAIGIDVRSRGFNAAEMLKICKTHNAQLLFVNCEDSVLQRRFTATRRRHPLAKDQPIKAGIRQEREILKPLQAHADFTIDTTEMSIHDLRHVLQGHFKIESASLLSVSLLSFGFRYGPPREADIVMDVRFLQNPNWQPGLKEKTGLDAKVGAYIKKDDNFQGFMERFQALLEPLLPVYASQGKAYLTIAIGCTGGRHRSVYAVECLAQWLKKRRIACHKEHRDLHLSPAS